MRHQIFLIQKLGVTATALAFAPFFLAFHGMPNAAEVAIFAASLVPLCAAMIVARSGRIVAGHALTAAAFFGIAAIALLGLGAGPGCAFVWIVLAQVEACQAIDRTLERAVGVVTIASIAGCVLLAIEARSAVPETAPAVAISGIAALYGLAILAGTAQRALLREQTDAQHHRRWDAVAAAMGDLVVCFDAAGSVDDVSAGNTLLLGGDRDQILGRGLFDLVHIADRPKFLKLISDAAHCDETLTADLRLRSAAAGGDIRHFWVEMRARKVANGPGPRSAAKVVAILRDISATRDQAAEIEKAHRSIESAIHSKDQFLANMSHELRTPLNAIIGFSEMLGSHTLRPSEPAKQREYARIIFQSGQHLLAVVNSILDMSKLQSGTFAIIPEPFELRPLIDQCCDMISLKAEDGHIEIVRDVAADIADVVGDKRACKQILLNLLSNAVKFTPAAGRVTIKARPEGNGVAITVSDTGIGIADADLGRLGDPFFQARSSFSRPFEGTGLGLSVVRGLVGLHGGALAIESEPGRGTSVTVRLPLDCRALGNRQPTVIIETIPRHGGRDAAAGLQALASLQADASLQANASLQARMKKIA